MKYLKKYKLFETIDKKLYYHGRKIGRSPRGSSNTSIYLTDNMGYGISFSDMKELYVYALNFPESEIFSLSNPSHFDILKRNIDKQSFRSIVESSDKEMDWSSLSNIQNDKYELPEELFESLGFKAIKLRERPGIYSIYVFNEKNVTLVNKIDLTTPDMIKYAGEWFNNPGFDNPDMIKYK